jgi:hypothetical protein
VAASKMRFPGEMFIGGCLEIGASVATFVLLSCYYGDELLELPKGVMMYKVAQMEKFRVRILAFQFFVVTGWYLVVFLHTDETEIGVLFRKATISW